MIKESNVKVLQLKDRASGSNLTDRFVFSVFDLCIGWKAKEVFLTKHEQEPVAGLQRTVELILEKGSFEQSGEYLTLWSQGYRVVIALESLKVISYATVHHSRTLQEVRSKVPSRSKGKDLNYLQIIEKLDDRAIDNIKIPYAIVDELSKETGYSFSDVHDLIRDSIADALDEADRELLKYGKETFLANSKSYTFLGSEGHLFISENASVVLRKDGLRVKSIVFTSNI